MEWDPVTEKEEGIRRETSGRRGCDTEKIMMKKDPFLSSIQNPVGLQLLGENHSDHGTSINIYAYIYICVCTWYRYMYSLYYTTYSKQNSVRTSRKDSSQAKDMLPWHLCQKKDLEHQAKSCVWSQPHLWKTKLSTTYLVSESGSNRIYLQAIAGLLCRIQWWLHVKTQKLIAIRSSSDTGTAVLEQRQM